MKEYQLAKNRVYRVNSDGWTHAVSFFFEIGDCVFNPDLNMSAAVVKFAAACVAE